MALKEYGISVGKKLKAYGYRQGVSQYGLWQFFNYTEKVKDQTNTWIPTQKYTIWLTNKEALGLADGTDVEITSISKVTFHTTNINGKDIRVCDVTCEINVPSLQHNNNKGIAGNNYIPGGSFTSDNSSADDESFKVLNDDTDMELPF